MRALNIAATGMTAQQMRVEVISNNLANMNTTGYNARRAEFADLHYQQVQRPGTINAADGTVLPTGVQLGLGVRPAAVSVHLAPRRARADRRRPRRGHRGTRLHGGDPAQRRARLYPRRRPEAYRRGRDRHRPTAIPSRPRSSSRRMPSASPSTQMARSTRISTIRSRRNFWARSLWPISPTRSGLEALGDNLFSETEASGPAIVGDPGTDGLGMTPAGLSRRQFRRRGPRGDRADRGPARLRAERQGHHRGGSDDVLDLADPLRSCAAPPFFLRSCSALPPRLRRKRWSPPG